MARIAFLRCVFHLLINATHMSRDT